MAGMSRRFGRTSVVLLIVLAVVSGLLLLAQDQETLKIRSALGAEAPGHAAYVAALVGADLTRGNQFEVLTNGDQFLPAMLMAIAGARKRIVWKRTSMTPGRSPASSPQRSTRLPAEGWRARLWWMRSAAPGWRTAMSNGSRRPDV